jgi:glycosyltransferase involved in cell wall biosynthesis
VIHETITIGFTARERFSLGGEALQCLLDNTSPPFHLIVVDGNIPPRYRKQMMSALGDRADSAWIHADRYLLPNQARNLVIKNARGEFIVFIENDILVKKDWLSHLLTACHEQPADVAVPLIVEGRKGPGEIHFDRSITHIRSETTSEGARIELAEDPRAFDPGFWEERRLTQGLENHCMLFRRDVFERIGLFDEELNTREIVDLSVALYCHNVPVVFEPKCRVRFIPPPPVRRDERRFFFERWDVQRARNSHERIRRKWNLANA